MLHKEVGAGCYSNTMMWTEGKFRGQKERLMKSRPFHAVI